jgi:hypothetical protein
LRRTWAFASRVVGSGEKSHHLSWPRGALAVVGLSSARAGHVDDRGFGTLAIPRK